MVPVGYYRLGEEIAVVCCYYLIPVVLGPFALKYVMYIRTVVRSRRVSRTDMSRMIFITTDSIPAWESSLVLQCLIYSSV